MGLANLTCDGSLLQSATYSGILQRSRIQPAPKYPKIREVQESSRFVKGKSLSQLTMKTTDFGPKNDKMSH